jgi:hypothetical protein
MDSRAHEQSAQTASPFDSLLCTQGWSRQCSTRLPPQLACCGCRSSLESLPPLTQILLPPVGLDFSPKDFPFSIVFSSAAHVFRSFSFPVCGGLVHELFFSMLICVFNGLASLYLLS